MSLSSGWAWVNLFLQLLYVPHVSDGGKGLLLLL